MKTIIRNVNIVNNKKILYGYDLLINDNIIEKIDKNIILSDNNIINGDNLYVFGGFVNCCFKNENNIKNQARNGVTTVICNCNDVDKILELKELGYNVFTCIGALDNNQFVSQNALKEQYDFFKKHGIGCLLFALNSYYTDETIFAELVKFSHQYNLPIVTNSNNTLYEVGECDKQYGITPIRLLEEYGVLDNTYMLYGCENCEKDDVTTLSYHDGFVCVTPTNSLRCGNGISPVYSMLKNNLKLCVGGENILKEMSLFADLQSGVLNEAGLITNDDVLNSVTIYPNGLLGRNAGKVEVGQVADLVLLDSIDLLNLSTLNVVYTIANGKVIYSRN